MKKFLTALSAALLVVILALTMAGCDKSGSVTKAFEKEGYTVTSINAEDGAINTLASTVLTEDQMEELNKYDLLLCSKSIVPVAIVVKCGSSSELKDFLTVEDSEGNKDATAYDTAKEKGLINGNCYIITASSDALNIFKNA